MIHAVLLAVTVSAEFHRLLDDEWEARLREEPLLASSVGDHRYDDRLPSVAPADLQRGVERLLPTGAGIRLVKGAYREPPEIAFPRKRDVDANYLALAQRLLTDDARKAGVRAVFGTHDTRLLRAIADETSALGRPPRDAEFHLLYGIQRGEQQRLARAGHRVRVLVSYGSYWFPWYMRRLAERPANVLFVAKSLVRA